MEKLLSQRVTKLIEDYQELVKTAPTQKAKERYSEIQERYQLILDILLDPECKMNEALYYGILDLIAVNRKQKEEILLTGENAQ